MRAQLYTAPTIEPIMSTARERKRHRQSGVYQILCRPTGKVYIGSAVWLAKRKRHHREALLTGSHHSPYLQRAWNKYGPDAFELSILEYCEPEQCEAIRAAYVPRVVMMRDLADQYGVCKQTICNVINRRRLVYR